jgi:gamma-glutamylcysteine synthetase
MTLVREGLERQAIDELPYLEPLDEIVQSGRTGADALLDLWQRTGGEPTAVIAALAHPGLEGC